MTAYFTFPFRSRSLVFVVIITIEKMILSVSVQEKEGNTDICGSKLYLYLVFLIFVKSTLIRPPSLSRDEDDCELPLLRDVVNCR